MPVSYASSVDSIRAQRQLGQANDALSKSFTRLSSGLRINSAADDAAGLQVADGLRADARTAAVAIRNANDGISLTAIADSALEEISSILTRMAELANQSANGIYTNVQRSALSSEFLALGSEIERISKATTFNDLALISNSNSVTLQVGLDATANSQITISGVLGTLSSLGLASGTDSTLIYSILGSSVSVSQTAAQNALTAVNSALESISMRRGTLGAAENRLSHAINFLTVVRENYIAAESRIRDIDVAQEVADMTRLQVLQQAATAIVAQANLQPQVALNLLQ